MIGGVLGGLLTPADVSAVAQSLPNAATITQNVMLVVYDPIVEASGGQRLHEVNGWQDPLALTAGAVSDLETASHGVAEFNIVETDVVDEYPMFDNGFRFDDSSWAAAWASRSFPTARFDYCYFLREFDVVSKVDSGAVDEVWIYGDPLTQFWESTMAGAGAYWINGTPLTCGGSRAFVIMFWNYERGVGEAIHSYGHRTENMMCHIYGIPAGDSCVDPSGGTNWSKFASTELTSSGQGGVGDVHHPVNAEYNYDYNNQRSVSSNADAWATYPDLPDVRRHISAREWSPTGADPQRQYLDWWFSHLPHFTGRNAADGLLNNWWEYLLKVDQYKAGDAPDESCGTPVVQDLAEANARRWGKFASDRARTSVRNSRQHTKVGNTSIKFTTASGYDTGVRYPKRGRVHWDLTQATSLCFWEFAQNANQYGFQGQQPSIVLRTAGGSYTFTPDTASTTIGSWRFYRLPLSGDSTWSRSSAGTPSLGDVTRLEIHRDTWGFGFVIWYDGVEFG